MHGNSPNVIVMGVKSDYLFRSVIIENANFHVICSTNNPSHSGDEASSANRQVANVEAFGNVLRVNIYDLNFTIVKCDEHPRFGWVNVDAFDSFRASRKFAFDFYLRFWHLEADKSISRC